MLACLSHKWAVKVESPLKILFYLLALSCGMRDLSSLTRDWTPTPCIGSAVLTTGLLGESLKKSAEGNEGCSKDMLLWQSLRMLKLQRCQALPLSCPFCISLPDFAPLSSPLVSLLCSSLSLGAFLAHSAASVVPSWLFKHGSPAFPVGSQGSSFRAHPFDCIAWILRLQRLSHTLLNLYLTVLWRKQNLVLLIILLNEKLKPNK